MIRILCKIIGIQHKILEIDNQSIQCLKMVLGLWVILSFSSACIAFDSVKNLLFPMSAGMNRFISFIVGCLTFISLIALYRKMVCVILFESDGTVVKTLGIELLTCLIIICDWGPCLMSVFVGHWSSGFSIVELICMNQAGFSFMLLCLTLIILLNLISSYVLLIASKRHRHIATSIFNI